MPRANFYGSPASVIRQVREYSDALNGFGVIDLMIANPGGSPADLLKRMELFAKEVIPALHELP
jgi:hypothetical protein